MDPTHLVLQNIGICTAAMRKNSRWANVSSYVGARRAPSAAGGQGRSLKSGSSSAGEGAGGYGTEEEGSRDERGGGSEEDLMVGFVELRRKLMESEAFPPLSAIVSPFLSLIRSPSTTGPITSHALTSILSLLSIFPSPSPSTSPSSSSNNETPSSDDPSHLTTVLSEISSSVTHCKFEASDSQGDEVVLLKMLGVIGELVERWGGGKDGKGVVSLGDKEVCEMLETGLGMCCQMRLSELLRRTAESTVQMMVRVVFSRLSSIDAPPLPEALPTSTSSGPASTPSEVEVSVAPMDPAGLELGGTATVESAIESAVEHSHLSPEDYPPPFSPYGSPTTTELVRVLITLLNPLDNQHTDSMRLAALSILQTALETAGHHIGRFHEMRSMLSDEGCKYLFQLTRSDSPNLLSASLRVTSTLFATQREHLKPQLELFLSYLIDRLTPPPSLLHRSLDQSSISGSAASSVAPSEEPSTPSSRPSVGFGLAAQGESRHLLLEALASLARQPSFLVDLWVNYDCDMDCEDLFEKTVGFLTRGVYPTAPGAGPDVQTDAQMICLDILLSSVDSMALRIETDATSWPENLPSVSTLSDQKARKRILLAGASRFNVKPKTGLAFLEENGLLTSEPGLPRSKAIASLLKNSPRLDKKLLGDYLSRPDNIEILTAFIGMFDFKDKHVADAMRDLLEAFRLPGESQQINRITETFAEIFFASGPAEIKSQDAVYVLAYSIIMLNTDLFSPQVRKRMAFEDYKRNLRGVNDGVDFSDSFLRDVYDSIKKKEIILPEEHTGQLGFDYAWKELLARAPKAGPMLVCDSSLLDADMFKVVSKQIVSAIAYAFTTFNDDYVIQRAITGFRQCATIASAFHLPEVFDHIVMALSQTTGLLDDRDPSQAASNNPIVQVEGQSLTVSSLSVRFGLNYKSQLAAVVLFTIANGNGNSIREGWSQIFEMYQTLFLHSLLPTPMLQMEDFLAGTSMIPLQVAPTSNARDDRRTDGGLLSALSSYLLSPYGGSSDAVNVPTCTDDEIEATLSTVDCLGSCRFEELYSQIIQLDLDSLLYATRAIKDLADRRASQRPSATPSIKHPRSASIRQDSGRDSPAGGRPNHDARDGGQVPYDPASVFLMEMLVSLTSQAKEHVVELWPIAFEHLTLLLSSANTYSVLLIERAVVGLLRLCVVISHQPSMRDQLYLALDLLRSLPGPILTSVSEQLMAGVSKLFDQGSGSFIKSTTEWGLLLSLVRASIAHPEASKVALDLVVKITSDSVTAENFLPLVGVLSAFVDHGSHASWNKQNVRGPRRSETKAPTTEPAVERALKAINALYELRTSCTELVKASPLSPSGASIQFWLPPLRALASHTASPCWEIRVDSLQHLQRILPTSTTISHDLAITAVLFPMLDELLKPEIISLDPRGMEETRLRASALLCRVFLVYLSEKKEGAEDVLELWLGVVDALDRLMSSGRPDQLYEAVPESLKNLLLVLHSSNLLVPPSSSDSRTDQQREFWDSTAARIERFLPTFLAGVLPASEERKGDVAEVEKELQ